MYRLYNGDVMNPDARYVVRQKMRQRIAELSRIYPYVKETSGYCGQMLLSNYGHSRQMRV